MTMNNETKIEIAKDNVLNVGDVVEFDFTVLGGPDWDYFRAMQRLIIESSMNREFPNLRVLSEENTDEGFLIRCVVQEMSAEQQVQYAGVPFTALIVAAAVIGGGLFLSMSLDKVYKITSSPAGQVALVGGGSLGIALLLLVGLLLLTQFKLRG